MTRERIRQVEAKAMKKIRTLLRSRGWDAPTEEPKRRGQRDSSNRSAVPYVLSESA